MLLGPAFWVPGSLRASAVVVGTSDVDLLLGVVLVIAMLVVAMNLRVDLALHAIDAPVRAGRRRPGRAR